MTFSGAGGERLPPRHYSDWVPLLERFAEGDDTVLHTLGAGALDLGPGVAERITQRVFRAFNARIEEAQRKLQRDLSAAAGNTASMSGALVAVRRALNVLARFAALSSLPPQVQDHLHGELERIARVLEQDLEDSARRQGPAAESLLLVIRHNPLTISKSTSGAESTPSVLPGGPLSHSPTGGKRRIILPRN